MGKARIVEISANFFWVHDARHKPRRRLLTPRCGCPIQQAMLERATLNVGHLKHRRELDGKLMRVQQSKAFFMEEVAQAERRRAEVQVRFAGRARRPGPGSTEFAALTHTHTVAFDPDELPVVT